MMSRRSMLFLVLVALVLLFLVISFIWFHWRRQWIAARQRAARQQLMQDGLISQPGEQGEGEGEEQPGWSPAGQLLAAEGAGEEGRPSQYAAVLPAPAPPALTIVYQPGAAALAGERQYVRF